jgi:hypothetical protein
VGLRRIPLQHYAGNASAVWVPCSATLAVDADQVEAAIADRVVAALPGGFSPR